jgi:hypothetical protein
MESLTSPKVTVGVHCIKLRTKSMYINAVVDPAERTFYDSYDQTAWWCVKTQTALGPTASPSVRTSAAGIASAVRCNAIAEKEATYEENRAFDLMSS